ncbi:hypothetical protein NDU88_001555 [Pleurodeles waltl]|uniref:Uncharacterized protein n=1 Tax=Pleurodeles waltl TaxID=8319 RepID=A0AAV7LGA8_PLEWA|nr:hypothetical protein NDU88_001555 [Pleurodeles waltl]
MPTGASKTWLHGSLLRAFSSTLGKVVFTHTPLTSIPFGFPYTELQYWYVSVFIGLLYALWLLTLGHLH